MTAVRAAPLRHPTATRFLPRRRGLQLDADALDGLYRDHAHRLLIYFAQRTVDAEAATDLMAETFAVAFRDRRQFRGATREEAIGWLFGIARHQLSNYYRRGSVERAALKRLAVERRELSDADIERIEELASLAEIRHRIAARLEELEAPDREILRLRVVEERDYDEIARALGVNEDAARARLSRALKRLRAKMQEHEEPRLELAAEGVPR